MVPIQNISKGPKQPRSPQHKSTAQGNTVARRKLPRLDSIPQKNNTEVNTKRRLPYFTPPTTSELWG